MTTKQRPTQANGGGEYMGKRELAAILGVTPRTLDRWSSLGLLPGRIQLSARCVRWKRSSVEAWLERQEKGASATPLKG